MRLLSKDNAFRVSGGVELGSSDLIPATDLLLVDLSRLPPADRSRLLDAFTPAALRREVQREAAPTAGILSEAFIGDYSVAIVESRLGPSQDPVICIGQAGEEEAVVWDRSAIPYSYRVG
ncbi:hypothetical protein ACFQU1_05470 [Chelatococcus sp. GCM10030263]|uniref:hypothetical protein n=1 Tax=Chelatococcus sp. GCM10030263 TaxID=3273387 RepID=UPI0036240915